MSGSFYHPAWWSRSDTWFWINKQFCLAHCWSNTLQNVSSRLECDYTRATASSAFHTMQRYLDSFSAALALPNPMWWLSPIWEPPDSTPSIWRLFHSSSAHWLLAKTLRTLVNIQSSFPDLSCIHPSMARKCSFSPSVRNGSERTKTTQPSAHHHHQTRVLGLINLWSRSTRRSEQSNVHQ